MLSIRWPCLVLIISISCGEKPTEENSRAGSTPETTEQPVAASTLQIALSTATPNQSLEMANQAVKEFDKAMEASAGALVIELAPRVNLVDEGSGNDNNSNEGSQKAEYASKWCSVHGEPMAYPSTNHTSLVVNAQQDNSIEASDGGLSGTHENFAARLFHCKMKVNSESPDTIRGSYALVQGILCALEKSKVELGTTGSIETDFTIDDTCFGPKMVKESGGQKIALTVDVTVFDEGDWHRQIRLHSLKSGGEDAGGEYIFQLHNSEEKMAIKTKDFNTVTGEETAWSFVMSKAGEMRYERKSFKPPETDNADGTTIRMYAKGTLAVDIKEGAVSSEFTDVETFSGIYSFFAPHPDGSENNTLFSGTLATITGNKDAGYETYAYACNNAGTGSQNESHVRCEPNTVSTWYDVTKVNKEAGKRSCFPKDKACEGITPITIPSGKESFVISSKESMNNSVTPVSWFDGLEKPLEFTEVTPDFKQD